MGLLLAHYARPHTEILTVPDIAAGVEYLVSDGAGFVTGTVLDINGGFYMT
ncbi:hypothetical protein KFK14_08165 [Sphingobium phenoxybenzoativorans]|uniref:Uncharacterized protein n=1 Tax=Sphingobium phenoxybenzoativorans TaxID=1592790 RepID=A0A975Q3B7_9SPHN|nr:hypothetical protein [Sphingobium phenoxybenzoativorans]QUT07362.1 hypothetical protein KFK14_08165 [Sphingobium phenoxybenzoativorans]